MERHAFGLGLHHGSVAVDVDDEACQAIAFRVDEAEAVGVGIVGEYLDILELEVALVMAGSGLLFTNVKRLSEVKEFV